MLAKGLVGGSSSPQLRPPCGGQSAQRGRRQGPQHAVRAAACTVGPGLGADSADPCSSLNACMASRLSTGDGRGPSTPSALLPAQASLARQLASQIHAAHEWLAWPAISACATAGAPARGPRCCLHSWARLGGCIRSSVGLCVIPLCHSKPGPRTGAGCGRCPTGPAGWAVLRLLQCPCGRH